MSAKGLGVVLVGAALWLALASAVFADGGPHVAASNNGSLGLSSDNCAGCHRAHTAAGSDLLRSDASTLCLTCHAGNGATTDVVDGLQYVPSGPDLLAGGHGSTVLGALRGGGFSFALIDSTRPARLMQSTRYSGILGKVGVLPSAAKQASTSTHGGNGTVWGNGPIGTPGAGAGPATLQCASCHNPHGNGQYRILRPEPGEDFSALGVAGWHAPTKGVEVQDIAPCPGIGCVDPTTTVRNYTVLPGDTATVASANASTAGDYWRKNIPWNSRPGPPDVMMWGWDGVAATNAADNGGVPPVNESGLMTAWCIQCHTRYSAIWNLSGVSPAKAPSGDAIFKYRHSTMDYGCLQCHVSHGSNALMTGAAFDFTDPGGGVPAPVPSAGPTGATVTSGDSRLLKVDDRGTCQMCHEPTHTLTTPNYFGPVPTPGVP